MEIDLPTINSRLRDRYGIYHAVLYWIDPSTKKQKTKSKVTGIKVDEKGSLKKAEKIREKFLIDFMEEFKKEYMKDEEKIFEKLLFLNYIENSIHSWKNKIQYNTYKSYIDLFSIIKKYFLEKKLYLHKVKATHILDFYEYLSLERNVTNNTIRHYHALLRKIFKEATLKKILKEDIMTLVPRPKINKYISEIFSVAELNILLEAIKGNKLELEIYLAIFYGFRKSELLALKFSAVDFIDKTITVDSKITKSEKKILIATKKLKNDSSFRLMPLIDTIEEKILERKKRIEEDKKFFKSSYDKTWNDFICIREDGNLINPNTLTRTFKRILKKNDLKNIRFHDLRHSCATLLYKKGTSLKDIQKYLGHSDISTTANIYSHFDDSQKEKSINTIKNSLHLE